MCKSVRTYGMHECVHRVLRKYAHSRSNCACTGWGACSVPSAFGKSETTLLSPVALMRAFSEQSFGAISLVLAQRASRPHSYGHRQAAVAPARTCATCTSRSAAECSIQSLHSLDCSLNRILRRADSCGKECFSSAFNLSVERVTVECVGQRCNGKRRARCGQA